MQTAIDRLVHIVNGWLDISELGLTDLNWMVDHPNFDKVTWVNCNGNQLRELPLWPNVRDVYCDNNQLSELPLWPNVTGVNCNSNQLRGLPLWPKVTWVSCSNNPITYSNQEYLKWSRTWLQTIALLRARNAIRRWRRYLMKAYARRMQDFHGELCFGRCFASFGIISYK